MDGLTGHSIVHDTAAGLDMIEVTGRVVTMVWIYNYLGAMISSINIDNTLLTQPSASYQSSLA